MSFRSRGKRDECTKNAFTLLDFCVRVILDAKASGVAILVHSRHVSKVLKVTSVNDSLIAIDLRIGGRLLRVIAVYAPHAGYPWAEFIDCIDKLASLVMNAQDKGMQIIVGGDFNLNLNIGDRGDVFQDFISQFNLVVANGAGEVSAEANWTFRSSLGILRRIDFILCSSRLVTSEAVASRVLDLGSPLRSIKSPILLTNKLLETGKNHKGMES